MSLYVKENPIIVCTPTLAEQRKINLNQNVKRTLSLIYFLQTARKSFRKPTDPIKGLNLDEMKQWGFVEGQAGRSEARIWVFSDLSTLSAWKFAIAMLGPEIYCISKWHNKEFFTFLVSTQQSYYAAKYTHRSRWTEFTFICIYSWISLFEYRNIFFK